MGRTALSAFLSYVLWVSLAGTANAGPPAGAGGLGGRGGLVRLTLAEARAMALAQNAGIRAADAAATAAMAQKYEARASRFPSLSLAARYARLSDIPDPVITTPSMTIPTGPGTSITTPAGRVSLGSPVLNSYSLLATAQVPLFTGSRLQNREAAAGYAAEAAGQELAATQLETAFRTEQAYWTLHSARAAERILSESVRLVEAHLGDVRNLRSAGMATEDDILAAQVRLAEARLRQIQAEHAAAMAQAALCNVLALPVTTQIELADGAELAASAWDSSLVDESTLADQSAGDLSDWALPEVAGQDELVAAAMANRPDMRALTLRRQALERATAASAGARLPTVALQANYEMSNPNQRYFPVRDAWHGTWNAGVGVTWTAWDWGVISQQTARARAEESQLEQRTRQFAENLSLQVMQARLAVVESARRVAVAREAAQVAEAHLRSARARFAAGTVTNTEVLDSQNSLERARLGLLQAYTEQQIAVARLRYVTGNTDAPR